MNTLALVIDQILANEGGIKDVGDGKGETRFGQTPEWLEANGFEPPSTPAEAAKNYAVWMAEYKLDAIVEADPLAGYLVTDFAVHSGPDVAIKTLQRALCVKPDGIIGPKTVGALQRADKAVLARSFLAERLRFIGDLLGSMKTDRRKWARGWCNRLADQIEALL